MCACSLTSTAGIFSVLVTVWTWEKPSGNNCHFFTDTSKIQVEPMKTVGV